MRHHLPRVMIAAILWLGMRAEGYVEAPYALGRLVKESTHIILLQAEKVDDERNLIIYRKVADIKGTSREQVVRHNIGKAGFHPHEWQTVMQVVRPGRYALFFHNGSASETCIDNYWYQAYPGGAWWHMSHAEPFLLRSYAGRPERLAPLITEMLAGKEVIVPCMVDGDKKALQLRAARIQRLKASLAIQDYNPKRDFAGWGTEALRRVLNMPGFMQIGDIGRMGPNPFGIISADIDGDGQADLCLWGDERVLVLINAGTAYEPIPLPYDGGARSAAFADYNGDGKPDLLLATPTGLKLFTNVNGRFRDDSLALPQEAYYNLSAAAFIDQDGDGRPDILAANGFLGLRLYRNRGDVAQQQFEDVSEAVGLGTWGIGSDVKGGRLAVADVNGDGRQDFVYAAGRGVLVLNTPGGFVEAKSSGIVCPPGPAAPVFGDFDSDGRPDLLVVHDGAITLFRNTGDGRFVDVTASAGDLAKFDGQATSAIFADFARGKRLDLLIGCVRGPNRYYRNNGDRTFSERTEQIGLDRKVFNTRALCVVDLNNDGIPDLAFANEGQESAVLLSAADRIPRPKP